MGRSAIAARFEQVLTGTREELLVLDRPPYVADAERSESSVKSLLRDEVSVRGIYAPEALELPGALEAAQEAARAGEESRVHAAVPMKLARHLGTSTRTLSRQITGRQITGRRTAPG